MKKQGKYCEPLIFSLSKSMVNAMLQAPYEFIYIPIKCRNWEFTSV